MNMQTANAVVKAVVKMKYSLFPLKPPLKRQRSGVLEFHNKVRVVQLECLVFACGPGSGYCSKETFGEGI